MNRNRAIFSHISFDSNNENEKNKTVKVNSGDPEISNSCTCVEGTDQFFSHAD